VAKKKTPQKKTKKPSASKASNKKPAKKAVSKKAAVKKTAVKKAAVKKTATKRAVSKKAVGKKATAVKKSVQKQKQKPAKQSHLLRESAPQKKVDITKLVTPLDDRLIVQISGVEKKTPGGLYIPDTVTDTSGNLEGHVVAVGRGRLSKKGHLRPMDVRVGDRIVFSAYAGSKIKIQNEELVILREEDVMGVISK